MQEQATITATENQFKKMLEKTTVGYHESVFLNISGGRVRLLAGPPGASAGTYSDFAEAFFNSISGNVEAYFEPSKVLDYLDLVSSGPSSELEIAFDGTESDQLANRLRFQPSGGGDDFEVTLMLPSGESVMESVPGDLPKAFNADNIFVPPNSDDPLATEIQTNSSALNKILNAKDLREDLDFYPIVVRDGHFRLEVGDDSSEKVEAVLSGQVSGPDVSSTFGGHFKEVVQSVEGTVKMYTEDGAPLQFLIENNHFTARHMVGSAQ